MHNNIGNFVVSRKFKFWESELMTKSLQEITKNKFCEISLAE